MRTRLTLLTLLFGLSVLPAHAEDPSTQDMYRRYGNAQGAPVMQQQVQQPQPMQTYTPRPPQYPAQPRFNGQDTYNNTPAYSAPEPAYTGQDNAGGFNQWLSGFKQRAGAKGLNNALLNRALSDVTFNPRVIELDGKQPESTITFAKYQKNIVSARRVADGRARLNANRQLLGRIGRQYGVPPQYIVALWGIETNFGRNTGGFDIVASLATLAYEGRRASFFETELLRALQILQSGRAGTDQLTGSWAGAMGQCQFMPTSYLKYGADGDGDGTINIWDSLPDVFASTANYLKTEGWDPDLRWGRHVVAPKSISTTLYGRDTKKPLSYWVKAGVKLPGNKPLHIPANELNTLASLVAPDGPGTETFLVYPNYNVIMHWNRSTYFATSVGLLADAIANGPVK